MGVVRPRYRGLVWPEYAQLPDRSTGQPGWAPVRSFGIGTLRESRHGRAKTARSGSRAHPRQALQPAHGGRVSAVDSPFHLLSRQAPPARDGRVRSGGVSLASRDGRARRTLDAESGAVGAAVPLSRSPGGGAALAGRRGTREALAARAGGADGERGPNAARPAQDRRGRFKLHRLLQDTLRSRAGL